MLKNIKGVLKNKTNWTSIIVLIVTAFFTILNFIVDDAIFSGRIVSILLTLIAFEFFVLTVGLFDKILKQLNEMGNKKSKIFKARGSFVSEIEEGIKYAKHELIIAGSTLSHLSANQSLIINQIPKSTKIKLLATNIEDDELLHGYRNLIEREGFVENLSHLKGFENNENIEIRTIDRLPTAYFVGRDVESANGAIGAVHLLPYGPQLEYPCVKLSPDDELFDIYRKQIKKLWDNGKPWKSN